MTLTVLDVGHGRREPRPSGADVQSSCPESQRITEPQPACALGASLTADLSASDTRTLRVGGDLLVQPAARPDALTHTYTAAGCLDVGHGRREPRPSGADVQSSCSESQRTAEPQTRRALGASLTADLHGSDTRTVRVGGDLLVQPAAVHDALTQRASAAGWAELRGVADALDDVEQLRKSTANRIGALTRSGAVDAASDPFFVAYLASLDVTEKLVRKALAQTFKRNVPPPIQQWVADARGIGIPAVARLLGHLGDPYIARPHHWEGTGEDRHLVDDPPYARTVSQLWQYCGHGDPARSRPRKGMTADETAATGRPRLKSLAWNIAVPAMRCPDGTYRHVYEDAKERYADREGWTKGHQHAAALRLVGKEILRDLWLIAKANHEAVVEESEPQL